MQRKMPLFLCTMAVLVLCGLMLCFFGKCDFSELENRPLATWPSASMTTLTDGTFGEEVETYVADHFPFRDALISARAFLHLATGDKEQLNTLSGRDGWLFELPRTRKPAQLPFPWKRFRTSVRPSKSPVS